MSRRRRVLLALALAPVVLVVAFALRATVFAPRFDVPSIAAAPGYQDPALLAEAWALPVARAFGGEVTFQSNGSVCGPSSVANVFRSLGEPAATEGAVLDGAGVCRTGFCFMGLTLDELAAVAQRRSTRKVTIHRDLDADAFRALLARTNDPTRRFVVNFHRGMLFGEGTGHHSPIGGYLADRGLVFVLDVNRAFGPWLVTVERLFAAVDTVDGSSGRKRGLLEIE